MYKGKVIDNDLFKLIYYKSSKITILYYKICRNTF